MLQFDQVAIRLHPEDNVAIAKREISAGTMLEMPTGGPQSMSQSIPVGHKFALRDIASGEPIVRYGYAIGLATSLISRGAWVHSHNLAVGEIRKEYTYQVVAPTSPRSPRATFWGYRRADGQVGTRNYLAVIATVNCSAHVATHIARAFTPERLAAFPNVDGVIPIVHSGGCSFPPDGLTHLYLKRCLANVARNPNIGTCLYVGLGCEVNQIDGYCNASLNDPSGASPHSDLASGGGLVIQDQGGFRKTVAAGIRRVEQMLPRINAFPRTEEPISALKIALQCGGSDTWSGVTANPLVGRVMDSIVEQGGTAVLAETPEIFGAEHLLTRRVTNPEVGRKLIERLTWWNEASALYGFTVDNNPTPGNKRGGLTTIFEKSLGAVAKGGSAPLAAVYEYAECITQRGLVFMDTPGNDPVSATGQLAGGCNLIVFTTGRGSVFGSNIAPCIKVASNSALFARMADDMDYNAGRLLEGVPMEQGASELLALFLATASGQRTQSEQNGPSEVEFVPWQVGTPV